MGTITHPTIQEEAYRVVRRSARSNKGQHSKLERSYKKRKVDVVDDDEGEIRCLCGENVDDGGFMIQCDTCGKWQHGECMGYEDPEEVSETYSCELCRPDLYKDVSVPAKKRKKPDAKKTASKEKPVSRGTDGKLTLKKSTKRKTPTSEEPSDDTSDFSSDEDDKPLAPKKKARTSPPALPSPPPKTTPPAEVRRKPPPIITTRRTSQSSPHQRRASTSANPATPTYPTKTPLAKTFTELSDQTRIPAARIFAKIFEPLEPTKSEALGLAIENALFSAYATSEHGYGAEYKNRFRSISFNLKDAKNSALRERVLSGNLPPEELVKLSSEEMANQELRAQAEKIREEGVAQSVLKVQTGPRIRRTHKGEEIVGEDVTAITPTEGTASAPFARAEMSPSIREDDEAPASPRSAASNRSRSFSPPNQEEPAIEPPAERKQSASNFDIQSVWSHLRSPTPQDEPSVPMGLDVLPENLPQNQIDDPDIDRLINEQGGNSPPYSPTAYEFELPNTVTKYPPVWTGDLSMPSVAHFSAQARFVGGPHSITDLPWSNVLPQHLVIDGRIPVDTTTKYLEAQRMSSTKNIIVIQIEPTDDSHKEMFTKLYQYFHDRQRYGVLQIQSNIVKDAYLIPLHPDASIPNSIQSMDSHDIPRTRTEPSLLAVLVIQKNIPVPQQSPIARSPEQTVAPPLSTSPPNPHVSTLMSPAHSQPAAQVTPASTAIEGLGLSPADLAALQGVLIAHPEILNNPQFLTNPSILQNLVQQHLSGRRW